MRALIPCLLAASILGCDDPKDTGGYDCTTIAVSSVQVTLTDDAGAAISGASLTVSDDSGNTQDCEEGSGQYICGWEMTGDLTISASAEGFEPAAQEVTVESDGCHPITEDLTIALSPAS